ncbi:hypothetical protein BDW22DRAFT_927284 [Trametopsis cervina]|nr:hypothetical protein BDW22DRAFT_927284 [Trametopsis cervina]
MADGNIGIYADHLRDLTVSNRINIAIAVVNIVEYLVTFQEEVSRLWQRKWTLLSSTLLMQFTVMAIFSSFRVYAIWDRDWKLPLLVFVLSILPVGTDIFNYKSIVPQEPFSILRCSSHARISKRDILWFGLCNRLAVITADILVLASTWLKTFTTQRESMRLGMEFPIVHLLFRDGTIYFFAALMLNVAQLVTIVLSHVIPLSSISESSHWQALLPVIISRFLLNLRHTDDDYYAAEQLTQSIVPYSDHILGNLGAFLRSPFEEDEDKVASTMGNLEFASTNAEVYDAATYDYELDRMDLDIESVPRDSGTSIHDLDTP